MSRSTPTTTPDGGASGAVGSAADHGREGPRLPGGLWGALLAWSPVTAVAVAAGLAASLAAFGESILGARPAPFEGEIRLVSEDPECGESTYWLVFEDQRRPEICPKCLKGRLLIETTCWGCGKVFWARYPYVSPCPECGSEDLSVSGMPRGFTPRPARQAPQAPASPSGP